MAFTKQNSKGTHTTATTPRVKEMVQKARFWAWLTAGAEDFTNRNWGTVQKHFSDWAKRQSEWQHLTPAEKQHVKLWFAREYREKDKARPFPKSNPGQGQTPATMAEAKERFSYTKSVMFDDAARDFTRSTKWFTSRDGYPVAVSYSGMTVYFFKEDGYVAGRFGLPRPLYASDQAKVQALAGARSNPSASNPDDRDPAVIGHYLINKRGARFAGSPDNATSLYKLGDGRQVSVSWDGWEVSGNQHFAPKSGSGVHSLNDWLVNEPARQSARELAEQETKERLRKERKVSLASAAVQKFIKKLADGMELAGGGATTITPGSASALFPEVVVYNESVGRRVTVRLDDGSYYTNGVNGKQHKKLFDYLAKYGEWEGSKGNPGNPAVSAAQYRLAQAVLSGSAKGKQTMTKAVAREIVDRTLAKYRSAFMKKANPITLHVDNSEQANWAVKALKFLGYTGARKEVHKGKRTSYGYGLAPSREADTVYVFGGDQGISSEDADAIYHLLFHTQAAGMSSGSLQTVERLREKFTSKNGVNLIPARRKANPSSDADSMYAAFHGEDPDETVEFVESIHVHGHLAALGDLIGIKVRTGTGYDCTLEFKGVLLCSNEDGTHLYLQGGDQSVNLSKLHVPPAAATKESVIIGEVWCIGYHTTKDFDDFKPIDYIHTLGPEKYHTKTHGDLWDDAAAPKPAVFGTGQLPSLRYDTVNKLLFLDGGVYHIPKPLLETSPGITD